MTKLTTKSKTRRRQPTVTPYLRAIYIRLIYNFICSGYLSIIHDQDQDQDKKKKTKTTDKQKKIK
jgi:hypothetical protein